MANISFSGLASGMDTNAIIEGLMRLERIPIQRLESKIKEEESSLKLFQDLNSKLTDLESKAQAIGDKEDLDARSVTSSNEDVLKATAGSTAAMGSFSVEVIQTARQQSISSTVSWSDTTDVIGTSGDLDINGTIVSLLDTDTIQTVVNKINDADAGVSASVVQVAEGDYRISLIAEEAGAGQIALANGGAEDMVGTVLGLTQENDPGQSAIIKVNGLQITRNSNTISDAIQGVTLNVRSQNPGEIINVTVERDTEAVKSAVQDFVKALNDAKSFILDRSKYNAEAEEGGEFLGDSTARLILSRLSELAHSSVPKLPSARLSQLNDGAGVAQGSIEITDRNGGSAVIDLSNAYTIQDVLDAINNEEGIDIKASVNSGGTAIVLTDESEGAGSIIVSESGSTTAADLGILGSSAGDTHTGSDIGDGTIVALSTIGIETASDGAISINEAEFDEALAENFDAIVNLLTTSEIGLAQKAEDMMDLLTDPIDGSIKAREDAINARIDSMKDQIERMELRLEKRESYLVRQFAALEQSVAKYDSLGQFLSGQLAGFQSMNNN